MRYISVPIYLYNFKVLCDTDSITHNPILHNVPFSVRSHGYFGELYDNPRKLGFLFNSLINMKLDTCTKKMSNAILIIVLPTIAYIVSKARVCSFS